MHKTAFVVFNYGAFGGASKRYTMLFGYLDKKYPGRFYYIVNRSLFVQLKDVFPELESENIFVIDYGDNKLPLNTDKNSLTRKPQKIDDYREPPEIQDRDLGFPRKVYRFFKNYLKQREIFREIEAIRRKHDIKVFIGVFAGILPLTFYLRENPRNASVVFSDMDSWFSDIVTDTGKFWYRKYYSFNYALENSDVVDFLSPYIVEGVRQRNVKLKEENIHIAPCSFADYSRCSPGLKNNFEIAFVARTEPDKNPMLYLEAAREICRRYEHIKFHLVGEGTLVNEIYDFISSNELQSRINFVYSSNPPSILSGTSIFVSLQSGTNYPSQSVLEAMACSNAVIASNRGDTELFIKPEFGILVNLNKDKLTEALARLIDNRELTLAMGKRAREYVLANHTVERYSDYISELIDKAYQKHFKQMF